MSTLDKGTILSMISELIFKHHGKIDAAGIITEEVKCKAEGYIEALYQVESLINNMSTECEHE